MLVANHLSLITDLRMFRKILIAIEARSPFASCRVSRSEHLPRAVFSEADGAALHVRMSDEKRIAIGAGCFDRKLSQHQEDY